MTTDNNIILALGTVEVQAASSDGKKLPKITALAYNGDVMEVSGWGSICLDLKGMEVPAQLPILADHESTFSGLIGHGQAEVKGGKLLVAGTVSGTTDAAKQFVAMAGNGFSFQASVGAKSLARSFVAAGTTVNVNNRTIEAGEAGFYLISKSQLKEVSIVPLGADDGTSVSVAARRRMENSTMETKTDTQTVVNEIRGAEAAESTRVAAIRDLCKDRKDKIEATAISEGWDVMRTELEILRASRPKAPNVGTGQYAGANTTDVIQASLLMLAGKESIAAKAFNDQVCTAARHYPTCLDLCRAALLAEHQDVPAGKNELVRAGFSTISMPTALGNVANKVLLNAYNETPDTWRSFASIASATNFHEHTGVRPTHTGNLEQVAPGGELKHGTITEALFGYRIDTFGRLLKITRTHIINDDLGVFDGTAVAYGRMAKRSLSDLVYTVLLANAGSFFSVGNLNLLTGAESALGIEAVRLSITKLRTQRDVEGNDLDLRPRTLVVPPELETLGRQIINSQLIQLAATDSGPTGNALQNVVNLEVESRLSNTTKFAAASAKAWFLFASAGDMPVTVAFLNGNQSPTIEFLGLDNQTDTLGVAWRIYFDYGCRLTDHRAAVRSDGE